MPRRSSRGCEGGGALRQHFRDEGKTVALDKNGQVELEQSLRRDREMPEARRNYAADRSTAVFRVLQESLTNVARRAQARSVAVAMRLEECWPLHRFASTTAFYS